jgi:hypothetical protein
VVVVIIQDLAVAYYRSYSIDQQCLQIPVTPTGFHYDIAGGQSCRIGGKLVWRQTLLHNRLVVTVGATKLKSVFGNIYAQ